MVPEGPLMGCGPRETRPGRMGTGSGGGIGFDRGTRVRGWRGLRAPVRPRGPCRAGLGIPERGRDQAVAGGALGDLA